MVLPEGSRERVWLIQDVEKGHNLLRRSNMDECLREKKRLNKKAGYERYSLKGSWIVHRIG